MKISNGDRVENMSSKSKPNIRSLKQISKITRLGRKTKHDGARLNRSLNLQKPRLTKQRGSRELITDSIISCPSKQLSEQINVIDSDDERDSDGAHPALQPQKISSKSKQNKPPSRPNEFQNRCEKMDSLLEEDESDDEDYIFSERASVDIGKLDITSFENNGRRSSEKDESDDDDYIFSERSSVDFGKFNTPSFENNGRRNKRRSIGRRQGHAIRNASKTDIKGILSSLLQARISNISDTALGSQRSNFRKSIFNASMASQIEKMRRKDWLSSFLRLDPRWQIMTFFNEVAQAGVADIENTGIDKMALSPLLRFFSRAHVFSVWRPTSLIAIRKMMNGEAVGKGLDIKGKSAKEGLLSGYVPFLQIHSNEKDKKKIRTLPKYARIRVFFKSIEDREKTIIQLETVMKRMLDVLKWSNSIIKKNETDTDNYEKALQNLRFEMECAQIILIDNYSPKTFGLDIPERLFWEAFVVPKSIDRPTGTPLCTGRPSEPAFQDMNFAATRKPEKYGSKAVVLQHGGHDDNDPLCPLTLVMAYEEKGKVSPVVSDFDGFLIGTKGVEYETALPPEQINMMKRTIDGIEEILESKESRMHSWTSNWLGMLKKNLAKGVRVKMPQYGYGDPKTYSIMENAISRLTDNGAIRHGSECFNFFFPQELDNHYLVISNRFVDGKPWRYLSLAELQNYLCSMIKEGYTFPLNPKWVLCDKGWKKVYDDLLANDCPHVQSSLDAWYPPESGIRDRIESIYQKYPSGFKTEIHREEKSTQEASTSEMDLAHHEFKSYITLQRAKRKLRTILILRNIAIEAQKRRNDAKDSTSQAVITEN